ncbi:ATP-binding protein [Polymorphobacter sp.]|uniref:sensor histidine kinase n=1 Tax=Polymorphobacter sp. TaxID=1909290 RepID=UPI003F718F79
MTGRPTIAFVVGLLTLVLLLVGTAQLARRLPSHGLSFRSEAAGPLFIDQVAGRDDLRVPLQVIAIGAPATGGEIVPTGRVDAVRRGERLITADALASQDRLAAMAETGPLGFRLRDADGRPVFLLRDRTPTPLGWPFWTAALAGLAGALTALWVLVLRPRDPAARAIALAGMALCIAALPFAVLQNGEMIVGGRLWRALVTTNWVGAHAFGAGLIGFFAWFPQPLGSAGGRRAGLAGLAGVGLLVLVAGQRGWLDYAGMGVLVFADFLAIVALVAVQWRRSRGNPLGRAALRLVGSATVASLALFVLITYLPPLVGASATWADPLAFVLMLPPFGAIAIGVTRGWMLDLDRWAWRLLASALSLFLIIGVDLVLVMAARLAPDTATTIAIVLGAALWIVMRQALIERFFTRGRRDGAALLAQSGEIALGATDAERFDRWTRALERWFRPLSILPVAHAGPARLEEAGVSMLVGAPPFGGALRLYAADQGRSLFRRGDVALVDALGHLCAQTDAARQAYDRGMDEERERIARDLHDDVGGRLVTSLHRSALDEAQRDVRGAIGEMRQLLAGLRGGGRLLSEVIATCRIDAGDRLAAAGIVLDWPTAAPTADHQLRYSVFRAVEATLREAITNVLRHAEAGRVAVAIEVRQEAGAPMLCMTFGDDGIGLAGAQAEARAQGGEQAGGRGLANMRKRIGEVGGEIALDSGHGTRILVRVPLEPPPKLGEAGRRQWG